MASGSYCENKQFREYFTGLLVLATYAKFLNREDIYEQARDSYDAGVRQYNDKYCPKKGFWAKYKDNFIEGMGGYVSSHSPIDYFDKEIKNDTTYAQLYDILKNMPRRQVEKEFVSQIEEFNKKYK